MKFEVGDIVKLQSRYMYSDFECLTEIIGKDDYRYYHRVLKSNNVFYAVGKTDDFTVRSPFAEESVLASEYMAKVKFQNDLENLLNE